MVPQLYIHLPGQLIERHGPEGFGLYAAILPTLRRLQVPYEVIERPSTTLLQTSDKRHFHLVHHGFLRRFNMMNCGMSYIAPYWYVDPRGVLCDSSLARAVPDFDKVEEDRAARFFDTLADKVVRRGLSKHKQPVRVSAIGQGRIVVFLQGLSDPVLRNMYMTETEMLDLVVEHREGRDVLIKPHPKWPDTIARVHAEELAMRHNGVRLVTANVHDLLEGAYCSVSICSGAAFEGFLHRTPAILFGRSDFAACAYTVRSAEEAASALRNIRHYDYPYENFVYWFLRRKMFNARSPTIGHRVLHRIARTGFEFVPQEVLEQDLKARMPVEGKVEPRAPVVAGRVDRSGGAEKPRQ